MKPDDILNAIGEVDDAFIRKAHRKSFLTAVLVFVAIVFALSAIVVWHVPDYQLLLRYNPDASVNTGYVEPEVLIHTKWTSMEYTAYANGEAASTTEFRIALNPDYTITHLENGTTTKIVGSNGDARWPNDYLGNQHYANLYLSTLYSTDLIDRIDFIYINSEAAYGEMNQQLNCIQLEYFERGNMITRQLLLKDGRTQQEAVIGIKSYDHSNGRISGWKEWDPEYNLLAYAEYAYDGNTQTVSSYLADGTLTGTRISRYSFGNLRWREYYDADGSLVGREVYRYRPWELFFCPEGFIAIVIILSLAATAAFAVWDDRLQPGTIVVSLSRDQSPRETTELLRRISALNRSVNNLADRLGQTPPDVDPEQFTRLTEQIEHLRARLAEYLSNTPDSE